MQTKEESIVVLPDMMVFIGDNEQSMSVCND